MDFTPQGLSTMTSAIESADNYNRWILKKLNPYIGKNILEVGTGHGNFRKYLANNCESYISIDIDNEVIIRARENDPGGIYYKIDVSKSNEIQTIYQYHVDTVLCINVLEHIKDEEAALKNMSSALSSSGNILLFVPAFRFLYSRMDRMAGHFRRYTITDIKTFTKAIGLELLNIEYFNPIGGLGWFINKYIKHQDLNNTSLNNQVRIFDRYIVPISRLINPITKNIFGQSVICVLRK